MLPLKVVSCSIVEDGGLCKGFMEGLTVLLVEDSDDDAHLVQLAMTRAAIQQPLQHVCDGMEAIDYLRAAGGFEDREKYPFPRVMITDLKMPRMSGFELLEWLSNHPDCSVIPTVVLSASAHEGDVNRAFELGASAYFRKPATLNELGHLLGTVFKFWTLCRKPLLPIKCT
jgi:CheY-like chemotaxis protein